MIGESIAVERIYPERAADGSAKSVGIYVVKGRGRLQTSGHVNLYPAAMGDLHVMSNVGGQERTFSLSNPFGELREVSAAAEALFAATQTADNDAFRDPQDDLKDRAEAFVQRVLTYLETRNR